MAIQSLGFRTEMIFHRYDGIVLDRGRYLVVKTPANPGFFYGNFLLFFRAPRADGLREWRDLFRAEFADSPGVKHVTFLWDAPAEGVGDTAELERAGFQVDFSVVLTAKAVRGAGKEEYPGRDPAHHDGRRVERGEREPDPVALGGFSEPEYRVFKERQMARYRAMAERGLGRWFGAFLDGKLVGDLGIPTIVLMMVASCSHRRRRLNPNSQVDVPFAFTCPAR